jgi:hypothetical protein
MKSVRMGSVVDDGGGEVIQGRDEDMTNSEDKSSAKVGVQAEHSHLKLSTVTSDVDGAARLLRLAQLAEELGSSRIAEEARDLANRISEGRFYVACIGQFKRGKSTLINAPIGDPVLPVGFTPVTAVPTVIRFVDQRRTRIQVGMAPGTTFPYPISISTYRKRIAASERQVVELGHASSPPCAACHA